MSLLGALRSGRVGGDLRPGRGPGRLVVGGPVALDRLVGGQRDVVEAVGAAVTVVAGARGGRDVLLDAAAAAGVGHHWSPRTDVVPRPCPARHPGNGGSPQSGKGTYAPSSRTRTGCRGSF